MKTEEMQSQERTEIILEMAKARNKRPNSFELETYLRATRNFDPRDVRRALVELCVSLKKGIPKPYEVKQHLREMLRRLQIRPELEQVGPRTNYKINAGFIALALRLKLEVGSDRWKKARRKWDHANDFDRDLWSEKARAK